MILIATPDNSSSKEGDVEEEETGNEIQVEFEAIGPEEDFQGIRRLLQQFFVRNTDFVSTNLFRALTLDDPKKMIIQFQI